MTTGVLVDCDAFVADKLFEAAGRRYGYDKAIGLVDGDRNIVGVVLFHGYNGFNVEISYYGKGLMLPGVIRYIASYVLATFNASRLTATISKRHKRLFRSLQKLGFALEGTQRRYYGKRDCTRNVGVRLVMFREKIEHLAKAQIENNEAA